MVVRNGGAFGKQGLTNQMVIILIVSLLSLVVIALFFKSMTDSYRYTDSIFSCNTFINGVNGKPVYFNSSGKDTDSMLSDKFKTSLKILCPSRTVEVNEKNVAPAVNLIKDCYYKMSKGRDFLSSNVENLNFCLYCGRIESSDEFEFNDKLRTEFKNSRNDEIFQSLFNQDKETININEITLDDGLPNKIDVDNSIGVYYYIYRGKSKSTFENFKLWLANKVAGYNSFGAGIIYTLTDNNIDTFSGVVLYSDIEKEHVQEKNDCYYIVPDKHYD